MKKAWKRFRGFPKGVQIVAWIIAVGFIFGIIGSASSSSSKTTPAVASAPVVSAPKPTAAHLTVVPGLLNSWCQADSANANLTFYVTIRNAGGSAGTTQITPWRRFNDGSTNDGFGDQTGDIHVAAHGTSQTKTTVSYNPLTKTPLECRVSLGSDLSHYVGLSVTGN